ncbi:TPA: hypothetical protein Q4A38_14465 [Synechococcus sp. WH 5701]|uniref:hypothetical protein n=1 Tax=Synechococcus sp. WH 5701 TaxID=69042 RepID=UPI0018DDC39E
MAAPLGLDSVFFSFIERMAIQNGHICVDPPAELMDEAEPESWIEEMSNSSQHHFVIGYRYPPVYWKYLAIKSSTVCLLADPDGIARQVSRIHEDRLDSGCPDDIRSTVHSVRDALDATIGLAEWILADGVSRKRVILPAVSILLQPKDAFTRLETFYRYAGVMITYSCSEGFSEEALPLIYQLSSIGEEVTREVHRMLTLDDVTPQRLNAVIAVIGETG